MSCDLCRRVGIQRDQKIVVRHGKLSHGERSKIGFGYVDRDRIGCIPRGQLNVCATRRTEVARHARQGERAVTPSSCHANATNRGLINDLRIVKPERQFPQGNIANHPVLNQITIVRLYTDQLRTYRHQLARF